MLRFRPRSPNPWQQALLIATHSDALSLITPHPLSMVQITGHATARKYERSEGRKDTRAGSYDRRLQTKAGEVKLTVPKLRTLPFTASASRQKCSFAAQSPARTSLCQRFDATLTDDFA